MAAWSSANHCSKEQQKYWIRKTTESTNSASPSKTKTKTFLPLTMDDASVSSASIIVRVGQARIELQADFDPHLLRKVVGALEAQC